MANQKLLNELQQYRCGDPPALLRAVTSEWMASAETSGASKEVLDWLPLLPDVAAGFLAISMGALVESGGPLGQQLPPLVQLFSEWSERLVDGGDVDLSGYDMLAQSVVAHVARSDEHRERLAGEDKLLTQLKMLAVESIYGATWVRQLLRGRRGKLLLIDVDARTGLRFAFENVAACRELVVNLQKAVKAKQLWASHPSLVLADPFTAWGHYTKTTSTAMQDAVHGDESPDAMSRIDGQHILYLHQNRHGALRWNAWDMGASLQAAPVSVEVVGELSVDEVDAVLERKPQDIRATTQPRFGLYEDDHDTHRLDELLAGVGGDFAPAEGWLHGVGGVALQASSHPSVNDDEVQTSVVLEITICYPNDRIVFECFAGLGASPDEQLENAVLNFKSNSLDVLAEAYGGVVTGGPVDVFDFEDDGASWRAIVGGVGIRSGEDDLPDVSPEMVDALIDAMKATQKTARDHAFRVFYAFADGACIASEALMDGEPWEDGLQAMAAVPWPMTSSYTSFRIFAVVHSDMAPISNPDYSVDAAVALVAEGYRAQASEEALYAKLRSRGVSARDAELMIALVPMAFASVLMPKAIWPRAFVVHSRDRQDQYVLEKNAFYQSAKALASSFKEESEVLAVARVSAEFNVATQIMDGELDFDRVEGSVFSESHLFVDRLVPTLKRHRKGFEPRFKNED